MRRAEAGERRDEVDALVAVERARERFGLGGALDQPEAVAEPLDRRPRDEHGALERIDGIVVAELPRDGAQHAVRRRSRRRACIDEHERAGPVGRLRLAGREAALPEERRLLVAGDPSDGHERAEQLSLADNAARRDEPWEHGARDREEVEQLVVPLECRDVEQHRAGGVRDVRGVLAAELPQKPRVDRAEGEVACRACVREQPFELRRREVRIGDQAGALADQLHRQLGAACGRPPVLPDDRAADRLTTSLVPDERRLALVRDPDRVELPGPDARVAQRSRRRVEHRLPDLVGIVLHEPGRREVLAELPVAASERLQRVIQDEAGGAGRPLVDRKEHRRP